MNESLLDRGTLGDAMLDMYRMLNLDIIKYKGR